MVDYLWFQRLQNSLKRNGKTSGFGSSKSPISSNPSALIVEGLEADFFCSKCAKEMEKRRALEGKNP